MPLTTVKHHCAINSQIASRGEQTGVARHATHHYTRQRVVDNSLQAVAVRLFLSGRTEFGKTHAGRVVGMRHTQRREDIVVGKLA